MRRVILCLLLGVASCPLPPQTDPDQPTPDQDVPNPLPPGKAAKVIYDPATNEFKLTNVSAGFIWYGGDFKRPAVDYERETPDGWGRIWWQWCGTGRTVLPLGPGRNVSLGTFWSGSLDECDERVLRFMKQGGDV